MAPSLSLDELQSLAETLAAGFESLSIQLERQQRLEHDLRQRLNQAAKQYEELEVSGNSSSIEISDWRDEIVRQISPKEYHIDPISALEAANDSIVKARAALGRMRNIEMPLRDEIRKCPIAHHKKIPEELERDFTVPGKPSDLGCPFARAGDTAVSNIEDPIAAEFHVDKSSSRSQDAASRCPIRFLDKHSPEEIAQYFENHKHEIPRSHQICVKRYQQNEQSIRQLDAKYGNMVSMIQGLGNKHKQYLSGSEKVADEPENNSNKAVEKWAENVSQHSIPADETERVPRFDQPLRDIRVGESPSRPWGIPVPIDKSPAASRAPSTTGVGKPAKPPSSTPAPIMNGGITAQERKEEPVHPVNQTSQPQIIFNGPVFFGYPAEQAAVFLQNLNVSGRN